METTEDTGIDRLLLVDDNPTNLQVLFQALEDEGYELLVAQSGEEAIATAKEAQPQLILLDINMPGIDGYETCRRLKDDLATRDAVIIFLSARGWNWGPWTISASHFSLKKWSRACGSTWKRTTSNDDCVKRMKHYSRSCPVVSKTSREISWRRCCSEAKASVPSSSRRSAGIYIRANRINA